VINGVGDGDLDSPVFATFLIPGFTTAGDEDMEVMVEASSFLYPAMNRGSRWDG
jgi:hypothetical protein